VDRYLTSAAIPGSTPGRFTQTVSEPDIGRFTQTVSEPDIGRITQTVSEPDFGRFTPTPLLSRQRSAATTIDVVIEGISLRRNSFSSPTPRGDDQDNDSDVKRGDNQDNCSDDNFEGVSLRSKPFASPTQRGEEVDNGSTRLDSRKDRSKGPLSQRSSSESGLPPQRDIKRKQQRGDDFLCQATTQKQAEDLHRY
jgi:hypothetical protein